MNIQVSSGLIGHNKPPEPTPFEVARDTIDGLLMEAKNWLDGSGVTSQAEADAIANLLDEARKAKKSADEARKIEAKPFDDGKAEVQARYNPILARADLVADTAKKSLTPYLQRLEDQKRAKAAEERAKADAAFKEAQDALRASVGVDIAAREQAEMMLRDAQKAEAAARKAESDKASAKGGARAVTLRYRYVVTLDDPVIAARHMWATRRALMEAYLIELAEQVVRSGSRELPGFVVTEVKEAV